MKRMLGVLGLLASHAFPIHADMMIFELWSAETSFAIIVRDLFTQLSHTEWLNKDHTFNGMTHQMPFPN